MSEALQPADTALNRLCIVTAAMFLTTTEHQRLIDGGNHDKALFYQAKREASLRAMQAWAQQARVEVYCVVNGGSDADLERLIAFGVHLDDRRDDLTGKPALQRQAAFRLADERFLPSRVPVESRLFLWTEPDKFHLTSAELRRIAARAAQHDLTIVNRSLSLFASYNREQAKLEQDSNRLLNERLDAVVSAPDWVSATASPQRGNWLDFMHGPRVFRGCSVQLPIELSLNPGDNVEMYGILNKPVFTARRFGLGLATVEMNAGYPERLRKVDDGIAPQYRERQNAAIVANIMDWLEDAPAIENR